jgi:hypothetical protein
VCVCLLLQDLVQSCLRGEGGILEDMCYERRRREVREGSCIGSATMLQPWALRLILNTAALAAVSHGAASNVMVALMVCGALVLVKAPLAPNPVVCASIHNGVRRSPLVKCDFIFTFGAAARRLRRRRPLLRRHFGFIKQTTMILRTAVQHRPKQLQNFPNPECTSRRDGGQCCVIPSFCPCWKYLGRTRQTNHICAPS